MVNKIKSAFGGLAASALLAGSALGQGSSTNMVNDVSFAPAEGYNFATEATGITPEIISFSVAPSTRFVGGKRVSISSSGFQPGVNFNLEKSTNLIDWVKHIVYLPQDNSTNIVSSVFDIRPTDSYFPKSFYRIADEQ